MNAFSDARRARRPLRMVCIDHLAGEEIGRGVYRIISENEDVDLTLAVPARWKENFRAVPPEPLAPGARYRLETLPTLFPGKTNRCLMGRLVRLFRRADPDFVYVNAEPENFLLTQVIFARLFSRRRFKVIFVTWRNIHYSPFGLPYKLGWLYSVTERIGLRCGDHCFSFIESGRQTLAARGFEAFDVIPPATDTAFFRPVEPGPIGAEPARRSFTAGYFGRFVQEKGVECLLEAVAGLARNEVEGQGRRVRVLLVGNGPAREAWMARARELGIAGRVVHKPSVLRSEVPALLCACDVLALPSRTTAFWKEQFGRVLVEAMACGVPVIGSDSGEIPAVIGEAGLVFPEGNAAALREALRRMRDEPGLRERCAGLGRARAQGEFSCPAVAAKWMSAVRRLAGAPDLSGAGGLQAAPAVEGSSGRS